MANKSRILLFSDTHIGFDHPSNNKPGKSRRRGFDFFDNFKKIIDQAIALSVDYVIHCGDVFEKATIPSFLVDQTYAEFLRLANAGIKLFIVPGNHEKSKLPPSIFLNHPNIHVFDTARTYSFPKLSISGFPFYKGDIRSRFPEIRSFLESNLNDNKFNILCVHHAIDGVKAGHQFFEFRNRKDTLNWKDLPGKFDLILSGHIHKHQILKTAQGTPIIYSGSTERTMFDEIDEIKCYHTFNIKHKSFDHIGHPIPTRPMYQIDLRSSELGKQELSDLISKKIESFEPDGILQIKSDQEEVLHELSKIKTSGLFPQTMNVTLSGFSSIYRTKQN